MPTHFEGSEEETRALNAYIKLLRGSEAVVRRIHAHLGDAGVTVSQFGALEALFHLGPMSQRELGEKVLQSPGNITMVIDNLEGRGLVTRDRETKNRRTCLLELTPAGRKLIGQLFPAHVARVVSEFSALSPREQDSLGKLCKKLGKPEDTR
jgi:MarR family 2-MHQ and catechol resistance regulon transcriptional repressor